METIRSSVVVGIAAATFLAAAAATPAAASPGFDGCTTGKEDVTFRAPDGTRLAGARFGHGRVAVVLAHQSNGDLCQWVPYAKRLARLGYLALVFDFRNVGASEIRHYPANRRLAGDVAGAAREARRLGASTVFLVGASLGGSAVLQAATNVRPAVAGVVSVSGAADLSSAIESVPRLTVPVSYIVGKGDTGFAEDAKRLYAATPGTQKELHVLDDSRHGTALVGGSRQARQLVESFLRAHRR